MTTDIQAALAQYIAAQILKQPNRTVQPDEPIISSGLIDSFHLVDLALFVEDQFGVRLDDAELNREAFDSIAQLAEVIRQRQG
ncbi:MAG TPA: acyl carrier protein [Anaerolineales bacterium]|nr:acyl carrier protein [Anaerolineales bacterium]